MNNTTLTEAKPRYLILDGLRGIAAIMVLGYHLFEAVAFAAGAPEQEMYHGFLAVDFFFVLSGFVMGYAYDGQWKNMSFSSFCRRRLIRLHPMVVCGVLIGLIAYIVQGCTRWDGSQTSISLIITGTLLALFLLPTPTPLEVRGNTEAFPLNGPHWSLFFEYIGSIVYALVLHRMSTRWLKVWVGGAAVLLTVNGFLSPQGDIAYGWSSQPYNLWGGLLRVTFAYPMGLLMARLFAERKPKLLKGPIFFLCSAFIVGLLSIPSVSHLPIEGITYRIVRLFYQILCVGIFFPLIIWVGARGSVRTGISNRIVSILGRLSYPLYATHYPFIYLYIYWIGADIHPFGENAWITPVCVFIIAIITGLICMRFYDEPIRAWLRKRYLK